MLAYLHIGLKFDISLFPHRSQGQCLFYSSIHVRCWRICSSAPSLISAHSRVGQQVRVDFIVLFIFGRWLSHSPALRLDLILWFYTCSGVGSVVHRPEGHHWRHCSTQVGHWLSTWPVAASVSAWLLIGVTLDVPIICSLSDACSVICSFVRLDFLLRSICASRRVTAYIVDLQTSLYVKSNIIQWSVTNLQHPKYQSENEAVHWALRTNRSTWTRECFYGS